MLQLTLERNIEAQTVSTTQTAVIGLTGGIASGKSFVSALLTELGAQIIDADQIARQVVEPGEPALREIATTFGDEMLDAEGSLIRERLAEVVFEDAEARRKLNAITHPRIGEKMLQATETAKEHGLPWVVYDAALIVENNLQMGLDGLIVVSCDRGRQIERIVARDQLRAEDAEKRIDAQLPLADKVAVADWVIDNTGTREETRLQVSKLFDTLTQTFGAIEPHGEEE